MTNPAPRPEVDDRAAWPVGPMTFDEYLAFEQESDVRHEYVGGYAYPYPLDVSAMSGGTRWHNRIIQNVAGQLWLRTRGTACGAYSQGFKLRTPRGNAYYPDVVVGCGPPPPGDALYFDDPCLAVEVLSPSTRRNDFGEKRESYLAIPTLGAYLVVESTWRAVHRHWRDGGAWRTELSVGDGTIPLPCPAGGALTLAEIYEGVDVPDEPPRARLRRVKEEPAAAYSAD